MASLLTIIQFEDVDLECRLSINVTASPPHEAITVEGGEEGGVS